MIENLNLVLLRTTSPVFSQLGYYHNIQINSNWKFGLPKMERNFLSDFRQLSSSKKTFLKTLLAALLVVHVAKTVVRNTEWRDELSIFKVRESNGHFWK